MVFLQVSVATMFRLSALVKASSTPPCVWEEGGEEGRSQGVGQ